MDGMKKVKTLVRINALNISSVFQIIYVFVVSVLVFVQFQSIVRGQRRGEHVSARYSQAKFAGPPPRSASIPGTLYRRLPFTLPIFPLDTKLIFYFLMNNSEQNSLFYHYEMDLNNNSWSLFIFNTLCTYIHIFELET